MAKASVSIVTPAVVRARSIKATVTVVERPPDDHPVYTIVGLVASEWAHLEHAFDLPLRRLTNVSDDKIACITAQYMGVTPRINAIIALLTLRAEIDRRFRSPLEKSSSLLRKSFDLSERRNRIIHDPWYLQSSFRSMSEKGISQSMRMPRKDLRYGIVKKDREELKKTVADIRAITDEVRKLDRLVIVALEASRRNPPQELS